MIDPSQLITDDIVEETRAIYEKAKEYNLKGINFIGDAVVIYGAAKILNPRIICEIGTASGISSVLMLEGALHNGGSPTLWSYDMLDKLYYDNTKKVGFFLLEVAPHLEGYFHLRTGSYATQFIEDCNDRLSLAYIDANHCNPWAALDLLALLPALENNAYLMFDATDISVGYMQGPFYIYHYWNGNKFIAPHYSPPHSPTITGFLEYDGDAEKAVDSAIYAIGADWQSDVPDEYIEKITFLVGTHFGERYRRKLFDLMNQRVTQYRRYADSHRHLLKRHLDWVDEVSSRNAILSAHLDEASSRNAILSTELTSIMNSRSWRYTKSFRYIINALKTSVGRKKE